MRSKPLIVTSVKTDERITELHLWAVHEGLRRTPTATLFEDFCQRLVAAVCRFGALLPGCEHYIHNGLDIPTLGGATVTRLTRPGANAAKSMSGTYETVTEQLDTDLSSYELRRKKKHLKIVTH
jgi:hypothetical protein